MKIATEKQISFLEKIIIDTKLGSVYWDRLPSNSVIANDAFPNRKLDPEGVFSCGFRGERKGVFLIAMCNNERVVGSIGVNYDQMILLDTACEEIQVLLSRLFNLIYAARPNVNKFIDDYLNAGDDLSSEDTHP